MRLHQCIAGSASKVTSFIKERPGWGVPVLLGTLVHCGIVVAVPHLLVPSPSPKVSSKDPHVSSHRASQVAQESAHLARPRDTGRAQDKSLGQIPRRRNAHPPNCSCLESPMDRAARAWPRPWHSVIISGPLSISGIIPSCPNQQAEAIPGQLPGYTAGVGMWASSSPGSPTVSRGSREPWIGSEPL